MFDCPDLPAQTPSHYEYSVPRNYHAEKALKVKIYKNMKHLNGWCPREKASVLMDLIFNHHPEVVVEIGVWGGKSLIPMAEAVKYNQKGIVYGIDPWKPEDSVVGFTDVNAEWWAMIDHDDVMREFINALGKYRLRDVVEVIRSTSADAQPIYNIDLIHIDGNHSADSAVFDVKKWVPLVKKGGFIIFDDVDWPETRQAVNWLDKHCQRITTFSGANVWGVWVKL